MHQILCRVIVNYFHQLKARLPFPIMRERCLRHGLPTARGWDKLQDKLEEEVLADAQRAVEINSVIEQIFRETITLGPRGVQVFRLPEELSENICTYLANLRTEQTSYLADYPRPLSEAQLRDAPAGYFLSDIQNSNSATTLVFCSRRLIEERESRSRSQMGDTAINNFGWQDYDEFVLIKRRNIQCFEVVRVDKERKLVEIRVEMHAGGDVAVALNDLKSKVNVFLAARFGVEVQLINALNLFPAIQPLYADSSEGIVVELGFTTATGSAKHEKMRASGADLRNETYHVGGKAAISGAITPFRVAVRWNGEGEHAVEEVLLPGSIRQLGAATPYLDHMEITGVASEARMEALFGKVVSHIPSDA